LGNKKQFADWIQSRIRQYEFEENQDYVLISPKNETKGRGGDRRSIDYYLSLDMAKELSMVERNQRGKQVRKYFLECEKQAKAQPVEIDGSDPRVISAVVDHLYIENRRKDALIHEQQVQIGQQEEKLTYLDSVLARIHKIEGTVCLTDAAKTLDVKRNWFTDFLARRGWIYKRKIGGYWVAYAPPLGAGYLVHSTRDYCDHYGNKNDVTQVRITPKGLAKLAEMIEREKNYH